MFRQNSAKEESNFWISYADLMAGLLFVFILLIGAIVSKSAILKSELHSKEEALDKLAKSLTKSNALVDEKENSLTKNERMLKLKLDEIDKLNKLLLEANAKQNALSNKIVIVQDLLTKNQDELNKNKKSLEDYEGKVLILSNDLSKEKDAVKLKDEKLLALLNAMDESKTKYDELIVKLQAQKAKIKSLTGIKLQVIAALKDTLGDKINIDKKTGSLRLASNILFDIGDATLKPESKVELKRVFEEYIGALVNNENIKPHLDKIIIEGHTDSDGSYIYNLKLSQERALAVTEYLSSLDFSTKHNIKPMMVASGRAYLDSVTNDGVEDKNASRRIEIKFMLKNEDAMQEIEKVLDEK
jgi:chemotaxis protein MotB